MAIAPFKYRFNKRHGGSNLLWRLFAEGKEYLCTNIICQVHTHTAVDKEPWGETTYNVAGTFEKIVIDTSGVATIT